jgi:hypothetical protein
MLLCLVPILKNPNFYSLLLCLTKKEVVNYQYVCLYFIFVNVGEMSVMCTWESLGF